MRGFVGGAPPAIEYLKTSQLGAANGAAPLGADMKLPSANLPTHEHAASEVKFTDGKTFQEKLDAGDLAGKKGSDGKSAYKAAQDAGYTGTEEEFNALLSIFGAHASRHHADGEDSITPEDIGAATTEKFTVSVPVNWTADATNGGYTQTVAVAGVLATDEPCVDVVLGADIAANALYKGAWALVDRVVTAADSITLYANGDAPTSAFTIQLKVVR